MRCYGFIMLLVVVTADWLRRPLAFLTSRTQMGSELILSTFITHFAYSRPSEEMSTARLIAEED